MMLVYILFMVELYAASASPGRPIITTGEGLVQGYRKVSPEGKVYYTFEGVPYAEPTYAERRFEPAVPREPWPGVWPALDPPCMCLQYIPATEDTEESVQGIEDCLLLSIYTPMLPSENEDKLLDVVVYIHDGAFMSGFSVPIVPVHFMDMNTVLVTVNYRVGILGFFSTGDDVVPGNNGLKDQVQALKWVQRNIAQFGGDPNRVTLMGMEAGGASVHFHYLSPLSKGLFQRGVSFSGTALSPWAFAENVVEKSRTIGDLLGCKAQSSSQLVNCVKKRNPREVLTKTKHFQPWLTFPFSPFGPTAEKPSPEAFITDHPLRILESGPVQDLPWMNRVTSHEGRFLVSIISSNSSYLNELNDDFTRLASLILDYNHTTGTGESIVETGERIRNMYFGDNTISENNMYQLIKMLQERHFMVPAERASKLQAAINKSPVFFYYFSCTPENCLSETKGIYSLCGAGYANDAHLIFDSAGNHTCATESGVDIKKLLLEILTSFIKTGSPNVPERFGANWSHVASNVEEFPFLYIGSPENVMMEYATNFGNKNFWNSLPIKEPHYKFVRTPDEL